LSLGAAAILWAANRPSLDPEMLKAALASMPTLKVEGSVRADGEVRIADGATVKLEEGSIPAQAQPPIVMPVLKPGGGDAIKTAVYIFKSVRHGDGEVTSGWVFASGNAKSPSGQYCYYIRTTGDGNANRQDIANDRIVSPVAGVTPAEQAARFQKCQWWQGGSL
jgi:hypothetical protein